jgi:hypothetical protein
MMAIRRKPQEQAALVTKLRSLSIVSTFILTSPLSAQTSRPSDPILLEILSSLKLDPELTEAQQVQKGRERAEREYKKGRAELERYGLCLSGGDARYVDERTGLYAREMGCCITLPDEVKGYNDRLAELVASQGLPADARHLQEQLKTLDTFRVRVPQLNWVSIPSVAKGKTSRSP